MRAEEVDKILQELEQIRKYRKERGDLFIEAVLEASKRIKERYEKWYDKAIEELYKEIQLVNDLVPYDALEKYKQELLSIEKQFIQNKQQLTSFISALEKGQVKSFENVIVPSTVNDMSTQIIEMPNSRKETINFSVVLEALRIAQKIEEIEKSVVQLSNFIMNVIMITRRAK